jgi:hypothetical protein
MKLVFFICSLLTCATVAHAYERCHWETREDGNYLVCCDEDGNCRVTKVRQ